MLDNFVEAVADAGAPGELRHVYDTWKVTDGKRYMETQSTGYPVFPESVYRNLPHLLKDFTNYFKEGERRDVVLLSSFVALSTTNPNVKFRYERFDHTLHLFAFIKALSGFGKSGMRHALRFPMGVDKKIRDKWEQELKDWTRKDADYDRYRRSPARRKFYFWKKSNDNGET